MPIKKIWPFIILALLAIGFIFHCLSLLFTQDDAFISYRYVKNFLGGMGLVFNPGERVEGYTNFFFIILMILGGRLGINYIILSKLICMGAGAVTMLIAFLWAKNSMKGKKNYILPYVVPFLLMANSSFAYWAVSGLETLLFTVLIFYGLYLASKRKLLFVPIMALATLTRPEGGIVFGFTILYLITSRLAAGKEILKYLLIYGLLILPQIIFRMTYYGDLLPNPFYAKTGFSGEYLRSGIEYSWLFCREYGFYGLLILLPLVGYKLLNKEFRLLLTTVIAYIIYIIVIGGDVLHGHRFFVPLLPFLYLLFSDVLFALIEKALRHRRLMTAMGALIIFMAAGAATYFIPLKKIRIIRDNELGLVQSMIYQSNMISQERKRPYTAAVSTIGAFGYYSNAAVIDMLGLTDRTIAKYPQPFPGIESTWKERHYNIPYVMERNPDFILFSTGMKPSAPAEKALFLSSKFRQGYYPVFHEFKAKWVLFKRKQDFTGKDIYFTDARFINFYTQGVNTLYIDKKANLAMEYARQSVESGPPDFYLSTELLGQTYIEKGGVDRGLKLLEEAVDISRGYLTTASDFLAGYYKEIGDSVKAGIYFQNIKLYNHLD